MGGEKKVERRRVMCILNYTQRRPRTSNFEQTNKKHKGQKGVKSQEGEGRERKEHKRT